MVPAQDIQYESHTRTVQDLFNLYEKDLLNLEPAFQRESVWGPRDRQRLIDSVLRGYPLPSVFLYQRTDGGRVICDVIDGKQRIETLLMFAGQMRGLRFKVRAALPGGDARDWVGWNDLKKMQLQPLITNYRLQCIEVRGGLSDIINVFVRINSTGKALTAAERRHAQYFNSPFLTAAERLARQFGGYFQANKVFTPAQTQRMKDVELVCELMLSAHTEGVLNKKAALDKVMESGTLTRKAVDRAAQRTGRALKLVLKLLPNLRHTRFRQLADFYSLAVLVEGFDRQGLILSDRRRNRLACDLLTAFGTGVDQMSLKQKRAQGARPNEELFRDYLLTVLEGTDSQPQRHRRGEILGALLRSLFAKKDEKRGFSPEQRRILWNTTAERRCVTCSKKLTWGDFTIDHIKPWSKGGRTALENAALMCHAHNAAKGNKYSG
jgi:hypothetical protein